MGDIGTACATKSGSETASSSLRFFVSGTRASSWQRAERQMIQPRISLSESVKHLARVRGRGRGRVRVRVRGRVRARVRVSASVKHVHTRARPTSGIQP